MRVTAIADGDGIRAVLSALCLVVTLNLPASGYGQTSQDDIEFFERRIRPFLVTECYACHGPKQQEGGLRVDTREALRAGGDSGPAIVPHDVESSLLIQAISHQNDDFQMPKGRPKLPPNVIADFASWVKGGAPDPRDHPAAVADVPSDWAAVFQARSRWWSFQPMAAAAVPQVEDRDWAQQPVDRFILAKLEASGLHPARMASRHEWLRRVSFAITGLPPAPQDVHDFVNDPLPLARSRERVVDRLLASPHFGERWARHWMDLVRYAESYGHEQDYEIPHAWQYRDYLIRAFNSDVPYDQFVREHIAGDLLESPRVHPTLKFNESIIATGFWYLHQATHAPVDPRQDEADRIDNQIDVLSKTFLGLTVACARCHDHKFDAISSADYYSLTAYLRGSRQDIAFLDPDGRLTTRVCELGRQHEQITDQLVGSLRQQLADHGLNVKEYLVAAHNVMRTQPIEPQEPSGVGDRDRLTSRIRRVAGEQSLDSTLLEKWVHALLAPEVQRKDHPLYTWLLTSKQQALGSKTGEEHSRGRAGTRAESQELLPSPGTTGVPDPFGTSSFANWFASGQAFQSAWLAAPSWRITGDQIEVLPATSAHSGRLADELQGVLRSPSFTLSHANLHLHVAGRAGRVRLVICRYGLRTYNPLLFGETLFDVDTDGQFQWRSLRSDIRRYQGLPAYLELIDEGAGFVALDRVVLSDCSEPPSDGLTQPRPSDSPHSLAAEIELAVHDELAAWLNGGNQNSTLRLVAWMSRNGLLDWGDVRKEIPQIVEQFRKCGQQMPAPMRVLAMADGSREETRVLDRGDYRHPADVVHARFLTAIAHESSGKVEAGSGRLELAEMLVSADNPLLHRVFVNRVWAHLFGRGLVPTVDNFGAMGQSPTHPELLDYLTVAFRNDGTSIKRLIRSLCLSQAFAMSSSLDDVTAESLDPDNRLLHRQRLQRLEGEVIRDTLLAVAGTLDETLFGPSVPTHLTPFMGDPYWLTSRGIQSGALDGNGRRSVYLETRRNFLSPWMLTFDLAIPDTTVGQRNVSNIPAQSLALMNDPLVRQQAESCARHLLTEPGVAAEVRIERLLVRAFARPPEAEEVLQLMAFLQRQSACYGLTSAEVASDERVWADVCHIVFMLKEFIYVR